MDTTITVSELAKILGRHIAQGGGDCKVAIFHGGAQQGQYPLANIETRPDGTLEMYSGPNPTDPLDQPAEDYLDDLI